MITVKQIRALERLAHQKGVFADTLMENAGQGVYSVVRERIALDGKHIVIFAGTGNNGGDGLVAARYFAQEYRVVVLLFGNPEHFSPDAREQYEKIKEYIAVIPVLSEEDAASFHFQGDLVLIDALTGIGLQGVVHPPLSLGISLFNSLPGFKVAVDIPSGMDADSGENGGIACEPDLIITFHDLKPGLEQLREKTAVVDIGLGE